MEAARPIWGLLGSRLITRHVQVVAPRDVQPPQAPTTQTVDHAPVAGPSSAADTAASTAAEENDFISELLESPSLSSDYRTMRRDDLIESLMRALESRAILGKKLLAQRALGDPRALVAQLTRVQHEKDAALALLDSLKNEDYAEHVTALPLPTLTADPSRSTSDGAASPSSETPLSATQRMLVAAQLEIERLGRALRAAKVDAAAAKLAADAAQAAANDAAASAAAALREQLAEARDDNERLATEGASLRSRAAEARHRANALAFEAGALRLENARLKLLALQHRAPDTRPGRAGATAVPPLPRVSGAPGRATSYPAPVGNTSAASTSKRAALNGAGSRSMDVPVVHGRERAATSAIFHGSDAEVSGLQSLRAGSDGRALANVNPSDADVDVEHLSSLRSSARQIATAMGTCADADFATGSGAVAAATSLKQQGRIRSKSALDALQLGVPQASDGQATATTEARAYAGGAATMAAGADRPPDSAHTQLLQSHSPFAGLLDSEDDRSASINGGGASTASRRSSTAVEPLAAAGAFSSDVERGRAERLRGRMSLSSELEMTTLEEWEDRAGAADASWDHQLGDESGGGGPCGEIASDRVVPGRRGSCTMLSGVNAPAPRAMRRHSSIVGSVGGFALEQPSAPLLPPEAMIPVEAGGAHMLHAQSQQHPIAHSHSLLPPMHAHLQSKSSPSHGTPGNSAPLRLATSLDLDLRVSSARTDDDGIALHLSSGDNASPLPMHRTSSVQASPPAAPGSLSRGVHNGTAMPSSRDGPLSIRTTLREPGRLGHERSIHALPVLSGADLSVAADDGANADAAAHRVTATSASSGGFPPHARISTASRRRSSGASDSPTAQRRVVFASRLDSDSAVARRSSISESMDVSCDVGGCAKDDSDASPRADVEASDVDAASTEGDAAGLVPPLRRSAGARRRALRAEPSLHRASLTAFLAVGAQDADIAPVLQPPANPLVAAAPAKKPLVAATSWFGSLFTASGATAAAAAQAPLPAHVTKVPSLPQDDLPEPQDERERRRRRTADEQYTTLTGAMDQSRVTANAAATAAATAFELSEPKQPARGVPLRRSRRGRAAQSSVRRAFRSLPRALVQLRTAFPLPRLSGSSSIAAMLDSSAGAAGGLAAAPAGELPSDDATGILHVHRAIGDRASVIPSTPHCNGSNSSIVLAALERVPLFRSLDVVERDVLAASLERVIVDDGCVIIPSLLHQRSTPSPDSTTRNSRSMRLVAGRGSFINAFVVVLDGAVAIVRASNAMDADGAVPFAAHRENRPSHPTLMLRRGDALIGDSLPAHSGAVARGITSLFVLHATRLAFLLRWFSGARHLSERVVLDAAVGQLPADRQSLQQQQQRRAIATTAANVAAIDSVALDDVVVRARAAVEAAVDRRTYAAALRRHRDRMAYLHLPPADRAWVAPRPSEGRGVAAAVQRSAADALRRDMEQAVRDLGREHCFILNGEPLPLGTPERTGSLLAALCMTVRRELTAGADAMRDVAGSGGSDGIDASVPSDAVVVAVAADLLVATSRTVNGGDSFARTHALFSHPSLAFVAAEAGNQAPAEVSFTERRAVITSVNTYKVCHIEDPSPVDSSGDVDTRGDFTTHRRTRRRSFAGAPADGGDGIAVWALLRTVVVEMIEYECGARLADDADNNAAVSKVGGRDLLSQQTVVVPTVRQSSAREGSTSPATTVSAVTKDRFTSALDRAGSVLAAAGTAAGTVISAQARAAAAAATAASSRARSSSGMSSLRRWAAGSAGPTALASAVTGSNSVAATTVAGSSAARASPMSRESQSPVSTPRLTAGSLDEDMRLVDDLVRGMEQRDSATAAADSAPADTTNAGSTTHVVALEPAAKDQVSRPRTEVSGPPYLHRISDAHEQRPLRHDASATHVTRREQSMVIRRGASRRLADLAAATREGLAVVLAERVIPSAPLPQLHDDRSRERESLPGRDDAVAAACANSSDVAYFIEAAPLVAAAAFQAQVKLNVISRTLQVTVAIIDDEA